MSEIQRWLSNSQMRSALEVLEELLERNGQTAVLRLSGLERYIDQLPPDNEHMDIPRGDMTTLFSGIVSIFGDQGARGVLRRWGRAFAARRLARRYPLRLLRLVLHSVSSERSTQFTLSRLLHHVGLVQEDQLPVLEERDDYFLLEVGDCLYCYGQNLPQPNCPAVVGLLEGLLRWTNGHDYEVTEEAPTQPGTPLFKIRKRPIGQR
ncbi:MAG TPA: hypothetical protein VJG32_11575 [Anaerolineae bacterium]|nr:hypothetical protein [Anaerolineae bacterium]